MRGYVPMLAVAGLLLCGALIAGCATTPTTNATTTPTSSATTVQPTTVVPTTTTATTATPTATTAVTTVATTATTATATTTAVSTATVDLMAQNEKFDKSTITVPAGATVAVIFNNKDSGVPHTFSIYTDSSASTVIFKGQSITGPTTTTYTFTAPSTPGRYYFRCDVHPTLMNGQFIVQ
ncbi:MAG TPA: hypothetical protein HA263_05850 [Methanoregulaceae archaeon]|nr:hypothetical protein [Methanoregulaceae archaeon]